VRIKIAMPHRDRRRVQRAIASSRRSLTRPCAYRAGRSDGAPQPRDDPAAWAMHRRSAERHAQGRHFAAQPRSAGSARHRARVHRHWRELGAGTSDGCRRAALGQTRPESRLAQRYGSPHSRLW